MTVGTVYLENAMKQFQTMKRTAERAIEQLSEAELFQMVHDESNSIAIIMKHMSGNMVSRWTDFLTSDGEKDHRNRDEEFEYHAETREQLLQQWENGWNVFLTALTNLTEDDLLKTVTIRQEPHSVLQAIERQMYHYSYHTGQIVYVAKWLRGNQWETLTIPKKKRV